MSIARMLTLQAKILRQVDSGKKDRYGDPITKPEEIEVACALQQRRREEHEEGGNASETLWSLYLPHGTEIGSADSIDVNGRSYELVGEPWSAEEGSRSMWHVEATVQRVAGSGES